MSSLVSGCVRNWRKYPKLTSSRISDCDFAVFILTADDITVSRGVDFFSPRDNLIFEAGISFGTFEPGRTFLIPEKRDGFKIPSDLNGFIIAPPFEATDPPDDAMKVPVSDIRRRINELGTRPIRQYIGSSEKLATAAIDLLRSAEHTAVLFGRDLSWASKYAEVIREQVSAGVAVEIFSDKESVSKSRENARILREAGAKIYYCERDTGIKLTLIDHKTDSVCQFMISLKERNPAPAATEKFRYRYTIHDARHAQALWLTLVRLYESLRSETIREKSKRRTGSKSTPN